MSGQTETLPSSEEVPHNLDAEKSLLGAMLLSAEAIAMVVGKVEPSDFYRPAHRKIFEAILSIYDEHGGDVDAVTVADRLEGSEYGGPASLIGLQANVPSIGNADRYAGIVREHAVRRRMIALGDELAESGFAPSVSSPDALAEVGSEIHRMILRSRGTDERSAVDFSVEALDEFTDRWTGTKTGGVSTGFRDLDRLIDGLHPGRSYIVGARPSMGKSALALNIASKVAFDDKRPVAFFSIEMDGKEVAQRAIQARSLVSSSDLRRGNLTTTDWLRIKEAQRQLGVGDLIIDPSPILTIRDVYAKCRQIKATKGDLALVVVDYIGIMSSSGQRSESRQLEVSEWSRQLKLLAKEVEAPVMILAQLSRNLEQRMDKRPTLADLRESGSLEQDADVVAFMYRHDKYVPGTEEDGFAEVIVAKNRHGFSGKARLAFIEDMARFVDLSEVA